jgi:transposase
MLGRRERRQPELFVAGSLRELLPDEHVLVRVDRVLDLGWLRAEVEPLYNAEAGRPGIDPEVAVRLMLAGLLLGIVHDRRLMREAQVNLAIRWFIGYGLHEALPDHSSLTRIRQRLGIDVFQRFFEQVVDLCQEVGLVWGRELYFDGTKVEANADFDTLMPRFAHEAKRHLGDLFGDGAAAPDGSPPAPELPSGIVQLPTEPGVNGRRTEGERPWRLLEERRLDPNRPSDRDYERMSAWRVSTTDPDATPMRTGARTTLGYHDHYVVDGGKRCIILAAFVTPADVTDNVPMRDLLWRVCFRRKIWPHQVTGDTKYGTTENIVAIENAGIHAYLPLPDMNHRRPFYGQDEFVYDVVRDEYRCPEGQVLPRYRAKHTEEVVVYRADAATCNACSRKAQCTDGPHGRTIQRSVYAAYLEKVRGYHATEAYKKAMRKRKVWVEPLFAEAKMWHGLRRLRLRGLLNANIQGLLIAAGQNLKRFLAATGWGRRHAPCGSLVALLRGPWQISAVSG